MPVVWLDLANAYESIPHQLTQVAMNQYYIPDHSSNINMNYFNNNNFSRFTTTSFKKILPQDASSLSNCASCFKHDYQGTKANTEICLAFNMGFIDDITVTAVTNIQNRWILKASNEAVS